MKKERQKEFPSSFAEGAISILTVLENNSRTVEKIYLSMPEKIKTDRRIAKIKKLADLKNIPFQICDERFIEENTIGSTHGGLIAVVGDKEHIALDDAFAKKDGFVCILEGIEDPYNFAYSVRSLYAAGVDAIILSSRNWMSAAGVCIRGSAGATELVPTAVSDDKETLIAAAKKKGYKIVCADIETETSYTDANLEKPLFLIVGGEKRGISRQFLDAADEIVKIDYGRDFNMSLTAASATSILAFEVLRQNKKG